MITLVPTADRQKATVLVRIGFKQLDPRILPDMGVKVTFLREADAAAAAGGAGGDAGAAGARSRPRTARATCSWCGSNAVERRAIKTGGTDGDRLEVIAGLKGGDRVVVAPPPELPKAC